MAAGLQAKRLGCPVTQRVGGLRERTHLVNDVVLRESSIHISVMQVNADSGVSAAGELCDLAEETYRCSVDRWRKTKDTAGFQPPSPCPPIKQAVFPFQRFWMMGKAIRFSILAALLSWSWISFERRQRSEWMIAIVWFMRIRNCTYEFSMNKELRVGFVHYCSNFSGTKVPLPVREVPGTNFAGVSAAQSRNVSWPT